MKVVSVINYKGGVGKTTLTANLGAYAASVGKRVLLIDLDPQTHLTFSFMTQEYWQKHCADSKTMLKFFEAMRRREQIPSLSSLVIPINNTSLKIDLLSSHLRLIDVDVKLSSLLAGNDEISLAANYMFSVSCLMKALKDFQKRYDVVLIDCPPNFNLIVKSAIYASDYYIVPTKLDHLSTMGINYVSNALCEYAKKCHSYITLLDSPEYKPLSVKMLGIVPMMVNVWKFPKLYKTQQFYLDKLKEENYYVFQYVRSNAEMFGSELHDRRGYTVPTVLAHFKADTTKPLIKGELKILCEDFLKKNRSKR